MEETESKKDRHHSSVSKSDSSDKNNFLDSLRENPWIVTSIVLAALLILLVAFGNNIFGGKAGSTVSKETAANGIISYINSQGAEKATLVSSEKDGTLYKVTINYMNQQIPVYTTLDGKSLIVNPIPLTPSANTQSQTQQQASAPAPTVVKSDRPKVELFVMSYCPFGTQAEKGIIPVVNLLKDKIDFRLKFVDYAMHPTQGEVEENTLQYCVQKEQSDKFIPYLSCFLKEGKTQDCLNETKVDKAKLNACINATDKQFNINKNLNDKSTWLNGRFPKYEVDAADNDKYGVQGSPTLIINGQEVGSARDSASLLKVVCAAFNNVPSECSQSLSSESPGPGFGFVTHGATGATTAECGV